MLQHEIAQLIKNAGTVNRDGLVISPYSIDFIFQERAFSINDVFDVPGTPNLLILFDPTATDYGVALPFYFASEDGPFYVTLYAGTNYTGGNSATIFNRYNSSTNSNETLITYSSTGGISGVSKGVKVAKYLIGNSGGPVTSGGGAAVKELPFVVDTTKKYLLEVENDSSTDPANIEIGFTWYE